jgi:hypothetical protein
MRDELLQEEDEEEEEGGRGALNSISESGEGTTWCQKMEEKNRVFKSEWKRGRRMGCGKGWGEKVKEEAGGREKYGGGGGGIVAWGKQPAHGKSVCWPP